MNRQEIISALTARARRCELLSSLYNGQGDRLGTLQYLLEAIASFEAAKAMALVSEYTAPRLMQVLINARAQGRAEALRKQPRQRRVTPQWLLRFALNRAAKRLTQANESTP
jgi:precorrin-4 methylase